MPPHPDSDTQPEPLPSLAAGLTAFKQEDYPAAIRLLEAALPIAAEQPLYSKAQRALVIAYAKSGQLEQAIQYGQRLCGSPDPAVRDWANETVAKLIKRQAQSSASEPIAPLSDISTESDLSGFVPLEQFPSAPGTSATPETTAVPLAPQETLLSLNGTAASLTQPSTSVTPAANLTNPPPSSQTPAQTDGPPPADIPVYQPVWQRSDRLDDGKSLGKIKSQRLLWVQAATLAGLIWLFYTVYMLPAHLMVTLSRVPILSVRSDVPVPPPLWFIPALLVLLWLPSRWVLDALLTVLEGLRPFSVSQLSGYSPEASQSLRKGCQKRQIPLPDLGLLPTQTPVIFSYGAIPRFARIVVSQGLLEQLAEDEIAALYAHEMGQIAHGTLPLMSLITVLLQLPYTLYRLVADWGNRQPSALLRGLAGLASVVTYSLFWLLRWFGLWLSRQRIYYSDRTATELTGNPSGVVRGILKLAIGMAQTIEQKQHTPYLLESFDVMMPIGHRLATTLGSLHASMPLEPVLEWERSHPLRLWLSLANSHPPTGDRLNLLTLYAHHWQLSPQLNWPILTAAASRSTRLSAHQWQRLLLQGAPYFGLLLGFGVAMILNLLGWVGTKTSNPALAWLYRDVTTILGLMMIGFGLGTFLRINQFFPDIPTLKGCEDLSSLTTCLQSAQALPIDQHPIKLEGTLLGRSDLANAVNQDLILETSSGLIRLHCTSMFSPLSNLLSQTPHPADLVDSTVVVTGWLRRGVTPWIDVETMRTTGGRVNYSYAPIWSTIAASLTSLWGIYIILRGNLL